MFKRINSYLKHTSPWILFTLAVYFAAFIYLFCENFIFSQSPELLSFRSVDDQWFQAYIRDIHKNLQWYGLNHYNYGWIYWFPMAVVMYPFYLLSTYTDIYMPLLALPREISLMFVMGTAVILYKIAAKYSQDKFLIALVLLLYLSYPATGFISLRFGTVGQNMFFSALAFYLAIISSKTNKKSLFLVAFIFAVAVATKITALLIGPLIFLVLADKFAWQFNRKNIILTLQFVGIFVLSFFYLAQINIPIFISNIKILLFSISNETPNELFIKGIATYTLQPIIFVLVLLGFLVRGLAKITFTAERDTCLSVASSAVKVIFARPLKLHEKQKDFIYIFFTLVFGAIYLAYTVKSGSPYVCYYFSVISFLLPLGVLALERFGRKTKYVLGCGILIVNIILNFHNIIGNQDDWDRMTWNIYYLKPKDELIAQKIASQNAIQKIMSKAHCKVEQLSIIRDYFSIAIFSPLRSNMSVREWIVVEDWPNALQRQPDLKYWDILGFDKRTIGFLPEQEVNDYLKDCTPFIVDRFNKDRKFVQSFLKNKSINGHHYEILWEDANLAYFMEDNLFNSCFAKNRDFIE